MEVVGWFQTLSIVNKAIVTVVIFGVFVFALSVLWQRPQEKEPGSLAPQDGAHMSNPIIPPGASGNFNFGQQGGNSSQTYINQAPPPAVILLGESDWQSEPGGVFKQFRFKVQNPAEINLVTVIAHGAGLVNLMLYLDPNSQIRTTGELKNGSGWMSLPTGSPNALRGAVVHAQKPTDVHLEFELK